MSRALLLRLLQNFQSRFDRFSLRRITGVHGDQPKRPVFVLGVVLLFGGALLLTPAWIQSRSASRTVTTADPALALLPEGARLEGDAIVHTCSNESQRSLVRRYYDHSRIFNRGEFERRLIADNAASFERERCVAGRTLVIPESQVGPFLNEPLHRDPGDVRAIYLQGGNFQPGRLAAEAERLRSIGANGIVFDVKDIVGVVNYRSSVPEVEAYRRHTPPIANLAKSIHFLHTQGIYVIARMALFQDENLAIRRPDLAIRDGGAPDGILLVKNKPLWVDPGQPEVRSYNWAILAELIRMGVDEVQFDYVRYPAEGNLSRVTYHDVRTPADKTGHLKTFLFGAWMLSREVDVHLAIDVFGIVAWGEEADVHNTGQRIAELALFVDVVSPMLYPSHFSRGFHGYANPADMGYHFYNEGVTRFRELTGHRVVVRPWIQAFRWRVTNFNEDYIRDQLRGSESAGGSGWMMWNAGNQYDLVYRALRNARAASNTEGHDAELSGMLPPGL